MQDEKYRLRNKLQGMVSKTTSNFIQEQLKGVVLSNQEFLLQEGWKQKESKLQEEKQRLQNELQGMVSKTTSDSLQEQLKDARETIVKLQIQVTNYKVDSDSSSNLLALK